MIPKCVFLLKKFTIATEQGNLEDFNIFYCNNHTVSVLISSLLANGSFN